MTAIESVLWAKGRMARHTLASIRNESKLKIVVVSVSAIMLWVGALYAFYRGFTFLQERFGPEPSLDLISVGDLLMARMLAVFALALFLMLIFSNVLIAFSTLYRSRECAYLLHTPLSYRQYFLARFVECVSFSSWASAYLGSPLLIAYGITTHAPPAFYLMAALFYVPFVVIPAAIGAVITMALLRVFPQIPRTALTVAGIIGVIALFFYVRTTLQAEDLAADSIVPMVIDATTQTQSPFLPSYWVSFGILASAQGQLGEAWFQFFLLLSNAMLFTWIAAEVAQQIFFPGYSALTGMDSNRARPLGRGILGRLDGLFSPLREPLRSLVVKDVKLFWRDATQWTQFVIFFGIMAIYVANLNNQGGMRDQETYRSWVAGLNIGACTLILATLTSRFVYPLISLEGRRFWILGLAPLTLPQLLWQKFWLSVLTTGPFTIGLVILSCIRLEVDAIRFGLSVYSIVLANLTLAGLAVGLGSTYPNFEEDNPARIVSGMGGTLNFLLSVGYIAVVVGLQMLILQWHVLERFTDPRTFWYALTGVVAFNTILSIIGIALPMRLGLRTLRLAEY